MNNTTTSQNIPADANTIKNIEAHNEEIRNFAVKHPRVQMALDLIKQAHQNGQWRLSRQGVLIYGASRTGKTRLLQMYRDDMVAAGQDPSAVIFLSLTGNATVDSVVTDLLRAVGDPFCSKGTIASKTERLERFLAERRIELVQIDEGQHILAGRSQAVVMQIASWFKSLMNDRALNLPKQIAFVFSGTHELRDLVEDDQLSNRFFRPVELQLFCSKTALDVRDLRGLLRAVEKSISVARDTQISSTEMAGRFRLASSGCIGLIVDLVHYAGLIALRDGRATIAISDLADAYDTLIDGDELNGNPFRAAIQDVVAGNAESSRQAAAVGGRKMNRRIRAKKKTVRAGDVLKIA